MNKKDNIEISMDDIRIPVSYLKFEFFDTRETADELLVQIGLKSEDLKLPGATISASQHKILGEALLAHYNSSRSFSSTPYSIHLVKSFNLATHGLLAMAMSVSKNLGGAFKIGLRYVPMILPAINCQFIYGEEIFQYEVVAIPGYGSLVPHFEEVYLLEVASFLKYTEDNVKAIQINFKHEPQYSPHHYEEYFGCPVNFNCESSRLILRSDDLNSAMVNNDRETNYALVSQLDVMNDKFQSQQPSNPTTAQSEEYLTAHVNKSTLRTREKLAKKLNMSPRTLSRKLQLEGTSYQSIVEKVMSNYAVDKLSNSTKAISQIAFDLGFNEPQASARAFKRWTGFTASSYRDRTKFVI